MQQEQYLGTKNSYTLQYVGECFSIFIGGEGEEGETTVSPVGVIFFLSPSFDNGNAPGSIHKNSNFCYL